MPRAMCCNSNAFLRLHITQDRRALEALPCTDKIPRDRDAGEGCKHHTGIVHTRRRNGNRNRHTEKHDGKTNPAESSNVDEKPELAQAESRVLDGLATTEHVDEYRDAVAGAEADGGDAREGVEGRCRAEVNEAEEAVDCGGEDEAPEGNVEL